MEADTVDPALSHSQPFKEAAGNPYALMVLLYNFVVKKRSHHVKMYNAQKQS